MKQADFERICRELGIWNRVERVALKWLFEERKVSPNELVHAHGGGRPDFIQMTTGGKYGYEVKLLDCGQIRFTRKQYNLLRKWPGEVLAFEKNEDSPYVIIPFSELPQDGGLVYGINIQFIPSHKTYYTTIAFGIDEKDELEKLRSEIENKILPQGDWADLLLQAMYAMLCDVGLIKFSYANRMGVKHFVVQCPYCNTDHTIEGRHRLYWMLECTYCRRKFVTKRKIMKKVICDFLA